MRFKTINGSEGPEGFELHEYVKEYIKLNSEYSIKLYLGTDSQNKNEYTTYATTLVFHIGNTGCHVVYKKNRVKRIPIEDYYSRLWGEVERSVEVALYLRNNGIEVTHVGLDLNSDPKRKSHRLVSSARGYVESCGFKCKIKPDILPAIKAADDLAR